MRVISKIVIFCSLVVLGALVWVYVTRYKHGFVLPKKDEIPEKVEVIVVPPDLSPGMTTVCVWPIISALLKGSEFANVSDTSYQPVNSVQELFLKQFYYPKKSELSKFKEEEKELRAWASNNAEELNAILKKEGFDIQLAPFKDPNEFGVVSILDILFKWLVKGTRTEIVNQETRRSYPAVGLKEGFIAYQSSAHEHPVACIETGSGDMVWMTIADKKRADFELLAYIDTIKKGLKSEPEEYNTVTFPMVDLDDKGEKNGELPWLPGLKLGELWYITQALQQTKLKMNEMGARVKSAVALAYELTAQFPPPEVNLLIDKPFYLWIEREGVSSPIFAGYIDQQYWKDPGTLDIGEHYAE